MPTIQIILLFLCVSTNRSAEPSVKVTLLLRSFTAVSFFKKIQAVRQSDIMDEGIIILYHLVM